MKNSKLFDRELSWLSFNYRVLQEAKDPRVPLYERIKFLAIYSSNLDEFFRVRVASLRSLLTMKEKAAKKLEFTPAELLKNIHKTVNAHQEEFGSIWRGQLIPELNAQNIHIVDHTNFPPEHLDFLQEFFNMNLLHLMQPMLLVKKKIMAFLQNRSVYMAVKMFPKQEEGEEAKQKRARYAVLDIPSDKVDRFIVLPEIDGKKYVMWLDDIIRLFLKDVFPGYDIDSAYSVKLTRDAELYIDDEFSGDLLEKIKKNLNKRKTGVPSRFLYDSEMPKDFLHFLRDAFDLKKEDIVPGGRYHNFHDLFSFPNLGSKSLEYEPMPPLQNGELNTSARPLFEIISEKDRMVMFPYQTYDHVIAFLETAARDKDVTSIRITLYRVASQSRIVQALIEAAEKGKTVTAFVEVKARFDEESNILSATAMEKAGVTVLYSFPGLKVHSKICLVERKEDGKAKRYCYLATGNFNEKTARIYSDMGMFTADRRLTAEVAKVFSFLSRSSKEESFKHLGVAPFNLREKLYAAIDREIANAKSGKKGAMALKMNSLEDKKMIRKLYEASKAGVEIRMNVRGICCLAPGVKGLSENISITSIVDRFLEHMRIYSFFNDGDPEVLVASADLMSRNLNRRIEVAFPIYDTELKKQVSDILELHLNDNTKARVINARQNNPFVQAAESDKPVRAQIDTYLYLKSLSV